VVERRGESLAELNEGDPRPLVSTTTLKNSFHAHETLRKNSLNILCLWFSLITFDNARNSMCKQQSEQESAVVQRTI